MSGDGQLGLISSVRLVSSVYRDSSVASKRGISCGSKVCENVCGCKVTALKCHKSILRLHCHSVAAGYIHCAAQ